MKFLRNLRVRAKLSVTFAAVLLPLLAAETLAIALLASSLRETAETELTNTVDHIYQIVALRHAQERNSTAHSSRQAPLPEDLAFLRAVVRGLKIGQTGYAYCMDSHGQLLIHPTLEGRNIFDRRDSDGFAFIQAIVAQARQLPSGQVGTLRYPWQDVAGDDPGPRQKILKFRYFQPWDWIIAAGSYEAEIFAAVRKVFLYTTPLIVASGVLLVVLTLALNRLITRPLFHLARAAKAMAAGDLQQRVRMRRSGDEFAELARVFNAMADEIREKSEEMERLIAERTSELRESREHYRSLVESSVDGIVTTDRRGSITFVNRGLQTLLGFSARELIGKPIWQLYPEGKVRAREIMRQLRTMGSVRVLEMQLLGKQRAVPIRTSASLLRDHEGREQGTLGIFTDVTAEKQLEASLRQTQAQLLHTMKLRALGDLVSGVAHEINNPLMAASTTLHMMLQSACPPGCTHRKRMEVLSRCHERIARIVNHLREFSRQKPIELNNIDIHTPIDNALLIIGQQLLNRQIEVVVQRAADLPMARGDANALEQVFLNLMANARDALETCEGLRRLQIRTALAELDGQPAVAVRIADNGPGIAESLREKIFQPFFTTKEVGKGTGLGLAIVYGIIEAHHGRIELDETEGQGASFTIRIPALADDHPAPAAKG